MTGKIYVGQSALSIILRTGIDLTSATDLKIYYRKPNGIEGYWNGSVFETSKIKYDVENENILDMDGIWIFWAEATINGKKAIGEPDSYLISIKGT